MRLSRSVNRRIPVCKQQPIDLVIYLKPRSVQVTALSKPHSRRARPKKDWHKAMTCATISVSIN